MTFTQFLVNKINEGREYQIDYEEAIQVLEEVSYRIVEDDDSFKYYDRDMFSGLGDSEFIKSGISTEELMDEYCRENGHEVYVMIGDLTKDYSAKSFYIRKGKTLVDCEMFARGGKYRCKRPDRVVTKAFKRREGQEEEE